VGWVLNTLYSLRAFLRCVQPPVGILPVGTGNDLARTLNWGPGYIAMRVFLVLFFHTFVGYSRYAGEKIETILWKLDRAVPVPCDRWGVTYVEEQSKTVSTTCMTNYFGIGIDAQIALDFHLVGFRSNLLAV
jgi:diacylglycerol kinase (ATP)